MIFHVILKILLYLLLIILILSLIICLSSIRADVSFWGGKFEWCIRYFGFRVLPRKKKAKTSDDDKKQDTKTDKKDEPEKSSSKLLLMDKIMKKIQKFAETMDMAGSGMAALPGTLRSLGKAITWYHIETDILIANEDAAKCAEEYGIIQAAVQNLISQTGNLIHVRRKQIRISCDFAEDTSRFDFRCRIKIHIGKTLIAGIVFLIGYLKDSRKAEKAVRNQKL